MPKTAEQLFHRLEQRLLTPVGVDLQAGMELEGILTGQLEVSFYLSNLDVLEIYIQGVFNEQQESLTLIGDSRSLQVQHKESVYSLPPASELRRGLVLGLLRMGLMHNLACLLMQHRLDGVDGSVEDWLNCYDFSLAASSSLEFGVSVRGSDCARARLWLDEHGLPLRREQQVVFPEGRMFVRENYSRLQLLPSD